MRKKYSTSFSFCRNLTEEMDGKLILNVNCLDILKEMNTLYIYIYIYIVRIYK